MKAIPATGEQSTFEFDPSGSKNKEKNKRRGPPNRMNDLNYRDWMKFQKSFFRYSSDQQLVEECISFFTKALWKDGAASNSLIIGTEGFSREAIAEPRVVKHFPYCESIEQIACIVEKEPQGSQDFVLIDLRRIIKRHRDLDLFLGCRERFFKGLRTALLQDRYACLLVDLAQTSGGGFPYPWAVAIAARNQLRLRDEKVALVTDRNRIFYSLFLQANDDSRTGDPPSTESMNLARTTDHSSIPAWVIPKPPPRSKNEILHPAKFPETLVEQFIRLFSFKLETVFDPMVGTGSTAIAALRTTRHAYGVDLSENFIRTSRSRIEHENLPSLFPSVATKAEVYVGDSTRLDDITKLRGLKFDYAITSPPYWSMLTNPGSETQRLRRKRNLPLIYSEDESDLGNIDDYDTFLDTLEKIYNDVANRLVPGRILTVVVKNVKRHHTMYPIAWDLTFRLCRPEGSFNYAGTTLWCQDDVGLKPFAVGTHWVSNILHTYCLHFQTKPMNSMSI